MFIDAHYQPHSSSVRVAALAAMSPTTPTHLVMPPHTGGGAWGRWGGTKTQHFLSGCWWRMLTGHHVLVHNQRRGQPCDYLFIRFFFCLHSHHHVWGTAQRHCHHLSRAIASFPLPFVMWKQPFSRGDFLGFHPDAWHSWQIGCGSEGDGLWKQCPCLHPAHCGHIHKGGLTHRYMTVAHVRTHISHMALVTAQPDPETKQEVVLQGWQGDDLDVRHTKKTGNINKSWLASTWTLNTQSSFDYHIWSSFCLAPTFGKNKIQNGVYPHLKLIWNVNLL